ncbi:MAG: trigger factor [Hyphomicrobiales bacterium]
MQVTETLNEGLKREIKVVVPASTLESRMMERLKELSGTAQIRGFRPGKVPVNHLKRMYGRSVMAEVVQKAVEDEGKQILADRGLKPAYQPEIKLPEDQAEVNGIMEGKQDLAFTMAFEVVPAVDIKDFTNLSLTKRVVKVEDKHVDDALSRIASQAKDYAEKDGAAETGDRVTLSFVGKIDGVAFDGGTAEDIPLELGSGQFIPGFEEQLVGMKAGEEKVINVTFPESYQVDTLAGKPATFDVKVSKIEAPKVSAPDDELAKRVGIESLEKLKEMVRERIGQEFDQMSRAKLKRDMLDALDKEYSFDLPQKLVDAEFNQIWNALRREMEQSGQTFESEGTTEEATRKEYREIAERRVRLGLVLGTIGEKAGITITDEEMERALIDRARRFPGQERQVYEFYRKNPNALMEVRGPVFEQKVVDHIASQAKIAEEPIEQEELAKLLEDEHDHDHDHAGHHHHHDHDHDHDHHHHDHDHGHHHHHDHDHDHDHGHGHDHDHGTAKA